MRKRIFSTMLVIIILFVVLIGGKIYPPNIKAMEGENVSAQFDISLFADQNYFYTSITSKRILWNIFKPGIYATGGIVFRVVTHRAMEITFDGVQNLESTDGNSDPAIRTWYAFQLAEPGLMLPEEGIDTVYTEDKIEEITQLYNLNWYSPDGLNQAMLEVPPLQNEDGSIWHIWNKIEIKATHGPGIYEDREGFTITLTQVD